MDSLVALVHPYRGIQYPPVNKAVFYRSGLVLLGFTRCSRASYRGIQYKQNPLLTQSCFYIGSSLSLILLRIHSLLSCILQGNPIQAKLFVNTKLFLYRKQFKFYSIKDSLVALVHPKGESNTSKTLC